MAFSGHRVVREAEELHIATVTHLNVFRKPGVNAYYCIYYTGVYWTWVNCQYDNIDITEISGCYTSLLKTNPWSAGQLMLVFLNTSRVEHWCKWYGQAGAKWFLSSSSWGCSKIVKWRCHVWVYHVCVCIYLRPRSLQWWWRVVPARYGYCSG